MKTKKIFSVAVASVLLFTAFPSFAQNVVIIDEQPGIFQRPIPENERCISFSQKSPFELNPIADSITVGLSLAGFLSANLVRAFGTYPEHVPGYVYDRANVPEIDRWAMNPYNKVLDNIGTGTSIFDAVLPVVTFGMEFLFSNLPKKDGATLAVMYAETLLTANAIKETMKINALRVRPYMYFSTYDTSAIKHHDFEFSLPSGHTVNAFAGATFLSYTFCTYYPDSNWKIPVIATSYAIAVGTGILRMTSGNHFFTDVLAGAALGSACGFLVPFAHTFLAFANEKFADYSEKTGNPKVALAALPMGLNVSIHF
ncbi:MAG: phosphatase PAP2 family protein [Treponema sp.]|nr:phosphatase PAP2 family protein [Treponema sp.]MBR6193050.1 phosphatase PAP2 family protein [Treponema sp.]